MSFEKQVFNDCIRLGDTWKLTVQFFESDGTTPIDLTGRVPRVQVRSTADAATTLLDLTDGSGLAFTAASGLIEISTATAGISEPGDYVWGLELGGSEVEEPVFGKFKVEQDIVR